MTAQSPRLFRVFVTGVGPAEAASNPASAIEQLRTGYWSRTTIGDLLSKDCLYLASGRVPPAASLAELLGFARTVGQPQIKGDLQPARALRRALADGRLRASDIGYACALERRAVDQARALHALERGLGRFTATIELETAQDPFTRAVAAVGRSGRSVMRAIALVIEPEGDTIALAFGRP